MNQERRERIEMMGLYRQLGVPLREVGVRFDRISAERVRQLIAVEAERDRAARDLWESEESPAAIAQQLVEGMVFRFPTPTLAEIAAQLTFQPAAGG
jgi:hypothetical protein